MNQYNPYELNTNAGFFARLRHMFANDEKKRIKFAHRQKVKELMEQHKRNTAISKSITKRKMEEMGLSHEPSKGG